MTEHTAVGFIGLGNIGGPMARHLLDWPGGLVVRDLNEEATRPFGEEGATVAYSSAEVAQQCGVISVMVLDDAQVRDVVGELLESATARTVIAIHSTVHAETAIDLASRAAEHGVEVVDAPVSGGFMGAHDARLAVMVGGSDAAVDAVREPFSKWADLFVPCGDVGSGTRMKLARNLMHFIAFTAAGEAMRLAEAAGLDVGELGKVVRHSDAVTGGPGAIMIRQDAERLAPEDPLRGPFEHTRTLGDKDLTLALELASELGVDTPLAHLALNRLATELGL
ncbi:MAG: NAD(P)-dependent oxidoreductase [Microthrixaceae bacterium]